MTKLISTIVGLLLVVVSIVEMSHHHHAAVPRYREIDPYSDESVRVINLAIAQIERECASCNRLPDAVEITHVQKLTSAGKNYKLRWNFLAPRASSAANIQECTAHVFQPLGSNNLIQLNSFSCA